jgi:hypothetical protein
MPTTPPPLELTRPVLLAGGLDTLCRDEDTHSFVHEWEQER